LEIGAEMDLRGHRRYQTIWLDPSRDLSRHVDLYWIFICSRLLEKVEVDVAPGCKINFRRGEERNSPNDTNMMMIDEPLLMGSNVFNLVDHYDIEKLSN
jgi:hypothetical protein